VSFLFLVSNEGNPAAHLSILYRGKKSITEVARGGGGIDLFEDRVAAGLEKMLKTRSQKLPGDLDKKNTSTLKITQHKKLRCRGNC